MTTKSMLPWPDEPYTGSPESWMQHGGATYQHARAEAALSRLRIAVEALKVANKWHDDDVLYCSIAGLDPQKGSIEVLNKTHEALAEIGEIPQS